MFFRRSRNALAGTLRPRWIVAVGLVICLAAIAWPMWAAEESAAADHREAPAPLPGEVGPVTYLLEDQFHKLQPVLGFRFEDFVRLLSQQAEEHGQQQRSSYSIDSVLVDVHPGSSSAEVKIEVSIRCYQSEWTSIPLRLSNLTLQESSHSGVGEGEVRVAEQAGAFDGYVAWLKTPAAEKLSDEGEVHKLQLSLLAPLQQQSGATQVSMNLPLTKRSEIRLHSLPANQRASVSGSYLAAPAAEKGGETFIARGQGGPVTLSWSKTPTAHKPGLHLDARTDIVASYSEGAVLLNATVQVSSLDGPVSGFQVRLPPESTPELTPQPGYVCTVQEGPTNALDKLPAGTIIDVRLEQPSETPRPLQLSARFSLASRQTVALSDWDVIEATRQHGHVFIQGGGSQQLTWYGARGLTQVDDPPAGTTILNLLTVFEFYQQPWSLQLSSSAPRPRLRVQPEHQLEIRDDQLTLRATWHCFLRGAGMRELRLHLGDWEFDDLEPDNLLTQGDNVTEQGEYRLLLAPGLKGAFDITLKAHQSLGRGANSIEISLPQLRKPVSGEVNFVENPGALRVQASDNLELQPEAETIAGLELQPSREGAASSEQGEWLYKLTGSGVKYAARWQIRPRQTIVETGGRVEIQPLAASVKQVLHYDVAYEPLETLWLTAPRQLPREQFELVLDGARLAVTETLEFEEDPQRVLLRVPLPRSRLGKFDVHANYASPLMRLEPASASLAVIELFAPRPDPEVSIRASAMEIVSGDGYAAALHGGGWNAVEGANLAHAPIFTALSREGSSSLPLTITRLDDPERAIVIVTQAFVQSRLVGGLRDEQINLRFATTLTSLTLQLPLELADSELTLRLDGQPATWVVGRDHKISVPLTTLESGQTHELEMRYELPGGVSSLPLELPDLVQRHAVRSLYWEVELPAEYHILSTHGAAYSPLMEWNRAGLMFTREPTVSSVELLAAAGGKQSLFSSDGNRYLFRGNEDFSPLKVQTVNRATWVLLMSGLTLGVGFALLYLPQLRNAKVLLAAFVLFMALSLIWPDLAMLAWQGGVLGMMLAGMAALLARWIQPRTPPAAAVAPNLTSRNSRVRVPSVALHNSTGSSATVSLPVSPPPESPT